MVYIIGWTGSRDYGEHGLSKLKKKNKEDRINKLFAFLDKEMEENPDAEFAHGGEESGIDMIADRYVRKRLKEKGVSDAEIERRFTVIEVDWNLDRSPLDRNTRYVNWMKDRIAKGDTGIMIATSPKTDDPNFGFNYSFGDGGSWNTVDKALQAGIKSVDSYTGKEFTRLKDTSTDEIFDFSKKRITGDEKSSPMLQFDAEGNRLTIAEIRKRAIKKNKKMSPEAKKKAIEAIDTYKLHDEIPWAIKKEFKNVDLSFGRTYSPGMWDIPQTYRASPTRLEPTVVQREIYAKSRTDVPPAEYYSMIHPYIRPEPSSTSMYLGSDDVYIPTKKPTRISTIQSTPSSKIGQRTGVDIPGVKARKLIRKQFLSPWLQGQLSYANLMFQMSDIAKRGEQEREQERVRIFDTLPSVSVPEKEMSQAEEVGDSVNLWTTEFIQSQPKFTGALPEELLYGGHAAKSEVAEKLDLPVEAVEMPEEGGLIGGMDAAAQARAMSASEEETHHYGVKVITGSEGDAQTGIGTDPEATKEEKQAEEKQVDTQRTDYQDWGEYIKKQTAEGAIEQQIPSGLNEPRTDIINKKEFELLIEQNIDSETGKITYKPKERQKGDVLVLENLTDVFNPSMLASVDRIQDIKIKGESYVYKDKDGKEHTTPERILSITEAFKEKIAQETAEKAEKPSEEEVNRVIESNLSIIEGTIDELNQIPQPIIDEKYYDKETGKWNEYTEDNFPRDEGETDEVYTDRLNEANFKLVADFVNDQKQQFGTSLGSATVGRLAIAARPWEKDTSWATLRDSAGDWWTKESVTVTLPDGSIRTEDIEEYKEPKDKWHRGNQWDPVPLDEIVRNDPNPSSQFKKAANTILSKIDPKQNNYETKKLKSKWEIERWNSIPKEKQADIIKYLRHIKDGSLTSSSEAEQLRQTYLNTVREPDDPEKASREPDKAKHNYLNHEVLTGADSHYNVQKLTIDPEFIKNMSPDVFDNWKKNNPILANELEETGEFKTTHIIVPYSVDDWKSHNAKKKDEMIKKIYNEFYDNNPQYKKPTALYDTLRNQFKKEYIDDYLRKNPDIKNVPYQINNKAYEHAEARIENESKAANLSKNDYVKSILLSDAPPTVQEVEETITEELGGLAGAAGEMGLSVKNILQDGNISKQEQDNILQDEGKPETIETEDPTSIPSSPEIQQIIDAAQVQADTIGPDFDTPKPDEFLTENGIKGNGDFQRILKEEKQKTGAFGTRVTDKAYSGMSSDYLKTLGIDIEGLKESDKNKESTTNNTITITDSDNSNIHIEVDDNYDDNEGEEFLKYDKSKLVQHTKDGEDLLRLQKEQDMWDWETTYGDEEMAPQATISGWLKESPELKNASPEDIQDIEKIILYHSNPLRYGKKFMSLPKKDQIEFAKKTLEEHRKGLFSSKDEEEMFTGIPQELSSSSLDAVQAREIYESIDKETRPNIEKIILDNRDSSSFKNKPLKEQIRLALDINKQNLDNLERKNTAYKKKVEKKKHNHIFDGEGAEDAFDKITGGGIGGSGVPKAAQPGSDQSGGNGRANGANEGKKDDHHTDFNSSDSNKKSRDNMAKDRVKYGSSEWLEREIEKLRQAKARNDRVAYVNIAKRLAPFTQSKTVMAMNVGGLIKEGIGGSAGLTSTIAATGYRGGRDLIKGVAGAPITAARGISGELAASRAQELELAKLGYPGRGGSGRGGTMESIQALAKMVDSGQQRSGQFGSGQGLFSERETLAMMGSGQSKLGDMGARATSRGSALTDFADRIQRSGGSPLTDFSGRVGATAGHLGGTLAGQMSGQVGGSRGIFTTGKEFLESRGQPTSLRIMGQRERDVMSFSLGGTLGLGGSMRPEQGLGSPSGFLTGELVPQRQTQNRAPNGRNNGAGFRGRNGQ